MKKLSILLLATSILSGCASIIEGQSQNINITTSNNKNVDARIFTKSGIQEIKLPHHMTVQKNSQDITIHVKDGTCNKESTTVVKSRLEPWFWGNLITGGIVGSTTDSVTGAMWKYDETVIVHVDEKNSCSK